jgi:hypothetical protein
MKAIIIGRSLDLHAGSHAASQTLAIEIEIAPNFLAKVRARAFLCTLDAAFNLSYSLRLFSKGRHLAPVRT